MTRILAHKKDEALAMDATRLDQLPVAPPTAVALRRCAELLSQILEVNRNVKDCRDQLILQLGHYSESDLHDEEASRIWDFLPLPPEKFLERASRMTGRKLGNRAATVEITALHHLARKRQVELLTHQLELEKEFDSHVECSFGLTPVETDLVHNSRTLRSPIAVLEAKIQGSVDPNAALEHEGA